MTDDLIPVFTYSIQPILIESFRWTEKYVGYKIHIKFTLGQCFSNQGDNFASRNHYQFSEASFFM